MCERRGHIGRNGHIGGAMVLDTAAATAELTNSRGSAIDTERHVKDW